MTRRRVDSNQSAIVEALRARGYSVHPTHVVGSGFPDIVVGAHGRNYLFEIKDPAKPPSARRLTKDELRWSERWSGQVAVIYTADEAAEIIDARE